MSAALRAALAVLALSAQPWAACAQDALVIVETGAPSERARAWQRRLAPETTSLGAWADEAAPLGTVDLARLHVLGEIEALLMSARRSAARLEERRALGELARAEALAEQHLAVPGMAAWYAEIELAIATTASQAGLTSLARAALRRAASVDPARTVQAAEAPPELVEQSREVARAMATGPHGRFEVRADAPGAEVFLDDRPLGALPRTAEAAVGRHVLRVEAPGHRAYAQVIDVLEGERAPVVVSLAPSEARIAARRAEAAASAGDLDALAGVLAAASSLEPPSVRVVWIGSGELNRALSVRCGARGCGSPSRLEGDRARPTDEAMPAALAWLDVSPSIVAAPDEPWWEQWYVWAGAGAVVAAAIAAIIAIAQPAGQRPLVFDFDASMLPR